MPMAARKIEKKTWAKAIHKAEKQTVSYATGRHRKLAVA